MTTMATDRVKEELKDITECCICSKTFTDPRMLPCLHTFCASCLEEEIPLKSGNKKKPGGEVVRCPVCGKEFAIPKEGFEKIPKNLFVEKLIEVTKNSQKSTENSQKSTEDERTESKLGLCDVCRCVNDGTGDYTPPAKRRCVDCRESLCGDCERRHKVQKVSRDHRIVEIGSTADGQESTAETFKPLNCDRHPSRMLDYYCAECRKVVCVSCFVEEHNAHRCSDVVNVADEFRTAIRDDVEKVSRCAASSVERMELLRKRGDEFLAEFAENEKAISKRSEALKERIAEQTESLLDDLKTMKLRRIREMETEKEEMLAKHTTLESFKNYCSDLASKGTAGDVCRSVDEIHDRTDELMKQDESYESRTLSLGHVVFEVTSKEKLVEGNRHLFAPAYDTYRIVDFLSDYADEMVGRLEVRRDYQSCLVVVGLPNVAGMSKLAVRTDLENPNRIFKLDPIPTSVTAECASAVHDNTLYVVGIGKNKNEIWKFGESLKWSKCGSLGEGRSRHCATFVSKTLYVIGGFGNCDNGKSVLKSVQGYRTTTKKCPSVGQLVHAVDSAASVAYGTSIYVFGGYDEEDEEVDYVQVYDTVQNDCVLSPKPMPQRKGLMRAALCGATTAVLIGYNTCFLFDFATETWTERDGFMADVRSFGMIVDNERIFVVGGEWKRDGGDGDGKKGWESTDEVRCVPVANVVDDRPTEWRVHAKLPQALAVYAYGKMKFQI